MEDIKQAFAMSQYETVFAKCNECLIQEANNPKALLWRSAAHLRCQKIEQAALDYKLALQHSEQNIVTEQLAWKQVYNYFELNPKDLLPVQPEEPEPTPKSTCTIL